MTAPKFRRREDAAVARKRILGAIHATAKKLHLEDDVYRDLIERVSAEHGVAHRSAGVCSPAQLKAIANELRRLTGEPARTADRAKGWSGRPKGDLAPQMAKVEALLADAGREWAYAHAVAKNVCKVARVEWCNPEQMAKVIAALQIDADRRARKAAQA